MSTIRSLLSLVCVAATAASLLGGCALPSFMGGDAPFDATSRHSQSAPAPGGTGEAGGTGGSPQDLAARTLDMAQRLQAAGAKPSTPPSVVWMNNPAAGTGRKFFKPNDQASVTRPQESSASSEPAAASGEPGKPGEPGAAPLPIGLAVDVAPMSPAHAVARDITESSVQQQSQRQLLGQLLEQLRQADEPALNKALLAAALSAGDPYHELDLSFLKPLDPRQQDAIKRYQQLIVQLREQLAGGGILDRQALRQRLDGLFGSLPISIQRVELCRRVDGFGIYEPLDRTTFLVGRNHKMIVYVEVDQFQPTKITSDEFEVKLTQEIVLYDEDGLAVWRHEPVQLTDRSRNRRRDFFTVQRITLPARLTVGKFHLKVRIVEPDTGNRDEKTIPVKIVADPKLVYEKIYK